MKTKYNNIKYLIYNDLTVISDPFKKHDKLIITAQCVCGSIKDYNIYCVVNNQRKSCGCKNKENSLKQIKKAIAKISKYTDEQSAFLSVKCKRYKYLNIELDDFINLIKQNCYYCNSLPSNIVKINNRRMRKDFTATHYKYNGLDRIDSSIGYTIENVVPCCYICNRGKLQRSKDEFISYIKQLYNNCKTKNLI